LHEYQKNAAKTTQMPKLLSDTQWAARANVVQHLRYNLSECPGGVDSEESAFDANGLLNGLLKFDFIFLLYFWFDV
jgi:hypothetical protein